MEDKNFNEYESLELIAKTIERARKTEIGRLNFITLYGILGLATYAFTHIMHEPQWQLLWIAVAALSYGVPFVYHRMWRKQMTITGRIVKRGWGYFALTGMGIALVGSVALSTYVAPLMTIVGSCALFMLSGIYKQKAILAVSFIGLFSSAMVVATNGHYEGNYVLFAYLFYGYCVYIGLSLCGNVDDIKTF